MPLPLVEREAQLAALAGLLATASGGEGQLAIISGEAGIGKTSLIESFITQHRVASSVLWGACDALFTPIPLGPLRDIAINWGDRLRDLLEAQADRGTVFADFLSSLLSSQAPTILVFEDLHWADEATLDLTTFLARRIHRMRTLFIISYRDGLAPEHPLTSVLRNLLGRHTTRIRLEPLSPDGVAALIRRTKGSTDASASLYSTTGGNPFFVTEVLASQTSSLPTTVRDAVLARVAQLSTRARSILEFASVVPGRIERRIVESSLAASEDGLEDCLSSGMLRQEGDSLAFRHELSRLAVEGSLAPLQRRNLHKEVVRALLGAGVDGVSTARLVHHGANAEDGETVLRFAPRAALQASAQGAHREAAEHYKTALRFVGASDSTTQAEFLDGLAYECCLTGRISEAASASESALAIWKANNAPEKVGRDLRWLSRIYWYLGRKADVDATIDAAVRTLEELGEGAELARAHGYGAMFSMLAEMNFESKALASKALTLAEKLGDGETVIHALNTIGMASLQEGDDSGWEPLTRSLHLALESGLGEHAARAYSNLTAYCTRYRHYPRAYRYAGEGIAYCAERDLDVYADQMISWRALAKLEQGKWADASEDASLVLARFAGIPINQVQALVALGLLRIRRGDPGGQELLDVARDSALPMGELQRIAPVMAARAEAAWLMGDLATCAAEARIGFDVAAAHDNPWALGQLAIWLWRAGQLSTCPPNAAHPFALQIGGDWAAAAAAWERLGCPYEHALALTDGDEAAQRQALDTFRGLGAQTAAELVLRILRHAGARGLPRGPRATTTANPYNLTERQMEILELLAEGLRTAEIAGRLSITPKTLDHHLSAVFAKLGVHTRAEAVSFVLRRHWPSKAQHDD